jgi:membrane protein DedA with SNARE-associated domain
MYAGILLGDLVTFSVGRLLGRRAVKSRWGQWAVPPARLAKAEKLFTEKGGWVIFIGRFLPGLRAPIFFSAGALHFSRVKFILIDGLAAIVSAPLFVWLGHWAWIKYAADIEHLQRTVGRTQLYFFVIATVLGIVAFSVYRSRAKDRKAP